MVITRSIDPNEPIAVFTVVDVRRSGTCGPGSRAAASQRAVNNN